MITKHLYDKSEWPAGPWMTEPDYQLWIDSETALPCLLRRNLFGVWVGAVGVSPEHSLYTVREQDDGLDWIDTHGGRITHTYFSNEDSLYICPPIRHWWIGFHCMHSGDLHPSSHGKYSVVVDGFLIGTDGVAVPITERRPKSVYRTLDFAKAYVILLAEQLYLLG